MIFRTKIRLEQKLENPKNFPKKSNSQFYNF